MDFPFSIYVWHAPRKPTDKPFWQEELRANNQQWAIYAAGLLYNAGAPHQDTVREHPVIQGGEVWAGYPGLSQCAHG